MAHPYATVLVSIFSAVAGLLITLWFSRCYGRIMSHHTIAELEETLDGDMWVLVRQPWHALLVGILVGLPAVLWQKKVLQAHTDFYAEFYSMSVLNRLRPSVAARSLRSCLPVVAGPLLAMAISFALGFSMLPAGCGTGMWAFLAYKEQDTIYRKAKARIEAG
jgi:hypothetical protein